MKTRELTPKQEMFCREYLTGRLNATEAAIKAGYSRRSAKVTASRLLSNANLRLRISEVRKVAAEETQLSFVRVLQELKSLAFSNIADCFSTWTRMKPLATVSENARRSIRTITVIEYKGQTFSQVRFHNKQSALDLICRLLGYYSSDKREMWMNKSKASQVSEVSEEFDFSALTEDELITFHTLMRKITHVL